MPLGAVLERSEDREAREWERDCKRGNRSRGEREGFEDGQTEADAAAEAEPEPAEAGSDGDVRERRTVECGTVVGDVLL